LEGYNIDYMRSDLQVFRKFFVLSAD
jgi:hypothetical protein